MPLNKVKPETMPSFKEESKAKIYPTFQLDNEDLPALKDFKVGQKYMLEMEVEQIAMRQGKEWQGSNDKEANKIHATFKITKVGVKNDEKFEDEYARKRAGGARS